MSKINQIVDIAIPEEMWKLPFNLTLEIFDPKDIFFGRQGYIDVTVEFEGEIDNIIEGEINE